MLFSHKDSLLNNLLVQFRCITIGTSMKNNALPPALVSNLQEILSMKAAEQTEQSQDNLEQAEPTPYTFVDGASDCIDSSKPVLMVTNTDGIDSPGLTYLVEVLVREGLYNVHVCAPQSEKSVSGHSVTLRETVAVSSVEINGATAYAVSGTPVDCVSLAFTGGSIFKANTGSTLALLLELGSISLGLPSLSISLNWKNDESRDNDFKDAAAVCLPLITAAIREIEKEIYPKYCFFNIDIPTSPFSNKGFKLAKQSIWRSAPNWHAVSTIRYPTGHFMNNHQSLGLQLAQLGRNASTAGAAHRLSTQKKDLEIVESVGAAGKPDFNRVKKYFRMEFLDKQEDETDEDLDYRALESGYVAVTPIPFLPMLTVEAEIQTAASGWISTLDHAEQ